MHRPHSAVAFLTLVIAASLASGQAPVAASRPGATTPPVPEINTIVDRMEAAQEENRSHNRPYSVTREYRLYAHDEQQPNAQVVAQVNFVPPDNKTFDIKQVSGSSRGEKIVKDVLRGESDTAQHYWRATLTRANYDFQYLGEDTVDGHLCYRLKLVPKRKETSLVKGDVWVDATGYLARRVEGELAKSPSWWLKSVKVSLNFTEIDGMWLQTGTKALAQVRFFGDHMLESWPLNFQTAQSVAQAKKTAPPRRLRPIVVTGDAVYTRP